MSQCDRYFSERDLILRHTANRGSGSILVDVGAHHGSFCRPFLDRDWRVIAFEPEPANHAELCRQVGPYPRATVLALAVSDTESSDVPFFTSTEHHGIHALQPFHPTHRNEIRVETVRLDRMLVELGIDRVDVLKTDIEGADLLAIRSFDFSRFRPGIVTCEFMDDRTVPVYGYSYHDLVGFVEEKGYSTYVFEWTPVTRYGSESQSNPTHYLRWDRYPPRHTPSWGNLIFIPRGSENDFERALAAYLRVLRIQVVPKLLRELLVRSGIGARLRRLIRAPRVDRTKES